MRIVLHYHSADDGLCTFGGVYTDWAQLFAIIPLHLTDERWVIRRKVYHEWPEVIITVDIFLQL